MSHNLPSMPMFAGASPRLHRHRTTLSSTTPCRAFQCRYCMSNEVCIICITCITCITCVRCIAVLARPPKEELFGECLFFPKWSLDYALWTDGRQTVYLVRIQGSPSRMSRVSLRQGRLAGCGRRSVGLFAVIDVGSGCPKGFRYGV